MFSVKIHNQKIVAYKIKQNEVTIILDEITKDKQPAKIKLKCFYTF